ncbi:MAG: T9SS type A sorting domain-containing protein [Bacteroidales bacterium]|nr:T9SS type A sorting domain-containing protein [Bacteroidales bacterium]
MKQYKYIFLVFLLFALSSKHQALTQTWSEPINISSMNGANQSPDLFIDKNGTLHCVWAHEIEFNYRVIFYSRSFDNGLTWSLPENISLNNDKWLIYPKIVADSLCNLYVSYDYNAGDPIHSKILFKTNNGSRWSEADTISGDMLNCSKNKLLVDHADRIYCFWNHAVEGGDYYYRFYENDVWSNFYHPYEDTNVFFEKVVIDSENNIHCLGSLFDQNIFYVYMNYDHVLDEWSELTQISEKTWGVLGSDIDVDENNFPHFTWRHKTYGIGNIGEEDSTLYRYFDGENWSMPVLVTEDPFEQKIQIKDSNVYIIDWEKNESKSGNIIMYEKDMEGTWIGELVIGDAAGTEVFLKSGDYLHFLYRRKPDEDNLNIYYTRRLADTITSASPDKFSIKKWGIFPNPFSSSTNIEFEVNKPGFTTLKVYSFRGDIIRTLIEGNKPEGKYKYCWDGKDNNGDKMSAGVYLIRLQVGRNIVARSVIIK